VDFFQPNFQWRKTNRMKFLITLFILFSSFSKLLGQSICQTGDEGSTLTLTAPAGKVFTSVTFASYGTPNGSCGSFTIGGCHAANSQTIVESILIGNNSGSIDADNTVFGDPCGGTFKRLYIEAVYGNPLPLKLVSFSGEAIGAANELKWKTESEINTSEIIIERSTDGKQFNEIGSVKTKNTAENNYGFTDNVVSAGMTYYRLKMVDIDGRYEYSGIITIKREEAQTLRIYPNPVSNLVTLNGINGGVELSNSHGQVLQRLYLLGDVSTVDLSTYAPGVYFLKCTNRKSVIIQKLVKK
jgi:hypothetical protein